MNTQTETRAALWQPGPYEFTESNMAKFATFCGKDPRDYDQLHTWSIDDIEGFWNSVWDFCGVIGERGDTVLVQKGDELMFGAQWYPQAKLNFAENLLCGSDSRLAVIEANESGARREVSMGELRDLVSRAQQGLRKLGVRRGDAVGGILVNDLHALVALLATTSLGAIWTSCSPDFGAAGIIDRIGQVKPRVLLAVTEYVYNGKRFDTRESLEEVLRGMADLEHLVLMETDVERAETGKATVSTWQQLCSTQPGPLMFERVPFNHPLYVMFTSGTTGLPKGIVLTAGGTLLHHRKEHMLHSDVRPGDVMSWYTNTAWMMYHWLISGLASHAAVVLYDGAPALKRANGVDLSPMWTLASETGVTHFGTSPRYLATLQESGYEPGKLHDLRHLRSVMSAGAPVQPEQFDWVYQSIKGDMIFASISGGTEIIGCFVLGAPLMPVRRGEITCKGLGMAVNVFDENGKSVTGIKGDLVCTRPFPSAPLTFWGENGDARYHAAYFEGHPGVWTHGDLAEQTDHGTVIIYGRTDTTLKPGGVRIGTAEIYRVVEAQPEIQDAIVFGFPVDGDEEIVLCLQLKDGIALDDALTSRIRKEILHKASPRHVPRRVVQVDGIPYTLNGKRVEGAAKSTAMGLPVKNIGSILNPQTLGQYGRLFQGV